MRGGGTIFVALNFTFWVFKSHQVKMVWNKLLASTLFSDSLLGVKAPIRYHAALRLINSRAQGAPEPGKTLCCGLRI